MSTHGAAGSARAQPAEPVNSFARFAQLWLESIDVSPATQAEYNKSMQRYWLPVFGLFDITTIRYSQLATTIKAIPWTSPKTRNNSLIPLRGVFDLAYLDEVIERNPMQRIRNIKYQRPLPDPFTRDEAETIIAELYQRCIAFESIYPAYFELAFFSGLRTSELLALRWTDIDFRSEYCRVEKAQSKGRLNLQTKTAKVRDVLLNARALHALRVLETLTVLRGDHVFLSPRTSQPFTTEKSLRRVFTLCLKRLGIRHRPAYNTRHTYATMLLMAGVNPHFVAAQLGHSVTMTLTVYSRWLKSDADRAELAKLKMDGRDGRI